MTDDPQMRPNRHDLGRVFNEVPEIYDRIRPGYPDELFAELGAITGMGERSSVLEVGCGTGQATRTLAALGCSVTAVEPGPDMAALARQRIASFRGVSIERTEDGLSTIPARVDRETPPPKIEETTGGQCVRI